MILLTEHLGAKETVSIVPLVAGKIAECHDAGNLVEFTSGTHQKNYITMQ